MAIASITAWLNSPNKNYHHGRLLYEQYGDDDIVLAIIHSGESTYHFNTLLEALTELNQEESLEPKPIIIGDYIAETETKVKGKADIDYKDAPEKILQVREQKNRDYAQARRLFEAIRVMDSQKHRLQAGLQLLDLMDQVNEAWSIIDEWKSNGNIREAQSQEQAADIATMGHADLLKEKMRLRPNISKDTKKLKSSKNARTKVKIEARLMVAQIRLEQVLRRLNEFV